MKSIEKLRELAADINSTEIIAHIDVGSRFVIHTEWLDSWHKAFDAACDRIEAEIAERYVELPTDADGTPIHVGDKMQYHGGKPFTVCAVAPGVIHTWVAAKLGERSTTYDYKPAQCTHYKPRTIEDVLREYALEMNLTYETGEIGGEERAEALDDLTAKYAKELRGMKVVEP